MPKGYKIKRYKRIYRGPGSKRPLSSSVLRWGIAAAAVLVLAFVGWNAYGPLMDYLSGALAASNRAESSSAAGPSGASSLPGAASAPAEPEPEPEPQPPEELRAVYVPAEVLQNAQRTDAMLSRLEGTDINALLIDLKDANGRVLYRSALPQVEQTGAQAESALDLAEFCKLLEGRGLMVIGRIYCFKDPYAASGLHGAGVRYGDTEMLWLDNDEALGGKPWLNPYAAPARDYLAAIAGEAASLGVRQLLLDSYGFPSGYALELANFGDGGVPRQEALAGFVEQMAGAARPAGCGVSLYVSGTAALGYADGLYGGVNPLTLSDDVTVGVMPAQFGDRFSDERLTLETPVLDPGATVQAFLEALAPDLAGKRVCGIAQAYTATNVTANRQYTAAEITAQVDALARGGVDSYIIYSPDGYYPQ